MGKEPAYNAGDTVVGLILGSGRSPGGGHGNPLWYSCLETPMDTGIWQATVHRVEKSWTRPTEVIEYTHRHTSLNWPQEPITGCDWQTEKHRSRNLPLT